MLFTSIQQSVDPRQQFFSRVVSVQNNRYAVSFSHLVYVLSTGDSTQDSGLLAFRFKTFAGNKCRSAVGKLDNDGRLYFRGRFQRCINRISVNNIYRRQCKVVFFANRKDFLYVIASYNTGFYYI